MPGPTLRTDIVEVYVVRRPASGRGAWFLQLRRARGALAGTWQPVMGHIEADETAAQAALRELREETGFVPTDRGGVGASGANPDAPTERLPVVRAMWQLEIVSPFFLAEADAIMLSPGFVVEVEPDAEPVLDDSHDASRWVRADHARQMFLWPGQHRAIEHIMGDILPADAPMREVLRIDLTPRG